MKRLVMCAGTLLVVFAAGGVCAAESLIRDGSFESVTNLPSAEFRCSNDGSWDGKLELFTEDLSWNKCAKLIAGATHDEKAGGAMRKVSSAYLRIGGTPERTGFQVEPNMYYEYSFELKGAVKSVIFRIFETADVDGKDVKKSALKDMYFAPGKDWRRFSGRYRTGPRAKRVELCLLMWTLVDDPESRYGGRFKAGDFVLVDNVSFVKSEGYVKLVEAMQGGREALRVAPFPVESDPSCPFLPLELADPPTQIVFRAAVNEKKPLPIAICNMTDVFSQYRVVLETEPGLIPGSSVWSDDGKFGLAGYPSEKITVREALRFKDTEESPVSTRFDPLVSVNEASVISVPPKEAGAVWFDFDTYDVKPGVYRGRLHVIPLNCGATYKLKDRRFARVRSEEKLVPVEFTVDPIVLPRESVRPAHLCSPCVSEQDFNLEADIGMRICAIKTELFRPEAVGDPASPVRRRIDDYRRWAKNRGVEIFFFVKYDALRVSQVIFNPTNDNDRKWPAWEQYVRTVAKIMEEAGVPFEGYSVLIRDEPCNSELETIREAQRRMKALYPKMSTYVSACELIKGPADYLDVLGETTDHWALSSRMYGSEMLVARLRRLKETQGTKLTHYLCSTSVKEPLSAYFRRHCWRGEYWGLDADMLYHFIIWNGGPYGQLSFRTVPQGELSYVADGRFLPSVRYMAYREGVTDIKYVQALREKYGNDPSMAQLIRRIAEAVAVGDATSPEVPQRAREKIRMMLLGEKEEGKRWCTKERF